MSKEVIDLSPLAYMSMWLAAGAVGVSFFWCMSQLGYASAPAECTCACSVEEVE